MSNNHIKGGGDTGRYWSKLLEPGHTISVEDQKNHKEILNVIWQVSCW